MAAGEKNSAPADEVEGFAAGRETFGNSNHGEHAKQRQIESPPNAGVRMSSFHRKPGPMPWALSLPQDAVS
jgi:hypothetical protein